MSYHTPAMDFSINVLHHLFGVYQLFLIVFFTKGTPATVTRAFPNFVKSQLYKMVPPVYETVLTLSIFPKIKLKLINLDPNLILNDT